MINSHSSITQKSLLAKHCPSVMEPSGFYGRGDSTGSCAAWSLSSFDAVCPVSPSPRCSSLLLSGPSSIPGSPVSTEDEDFFYSQISNASSSPRNNIDATTANKKIWGMGTEKSNMSNLCSSSLCLPNMQNRGEELVAPPQQLSSSMEGLRGYSSSDRYRNIDTARPPLMPMPLPTVREEQEAVEERSHDGVSSITGVESMSMTRPRPYHDFLDEVKKKEFEDKINAWKEAKHTKLMNKLRRKENAINAWEHKQTWKATMEMKKIENELERKRSAALKKMEDAISDTSKKADEKRARERRSTMSTISKIARTADRTRDTRNRIWLRLCLW